MFGEMTNPPPMPPTSSAGAIAHPAAAAAGLGVALVGIAAALVLAVVDLRHGRRQDAADAAARDDPHAQRHH